MCALTRAITLAIRDDTPQEAKRVNLVIRRKNGINRKNNLYTYTLSVVVRVGDKHA